MSNKVISAVRLSVLLIAVIFIAIGVIREEFLTVLAKAVRICMECIGIG